MKKKNIIIYGILGVFVLLVLIGMILNLNQNNIYIYDDLDVLEEFDITGTWYSIYDWSNFEYVFYENGTYTANDPSYDSNYYEGNYKLDKKGSKLVLSEKDEFSNRIEYYDHNYVIEKMSSNMLRICSEDEECIDLYRNKSEAMPYDSECLNPDKDGYCIEDGVLISYIGNEKEITIPSNVHTIGSNAFAADFDRGINTRKVTIPGTVRDIKTSAFAFTMVDEVIIEEGVETLGDYVFMDACLDVVYFPKTIREAGKGLFNPEERCGGSIDIHLYKGFYMDKHIKTDKPYYEEVNIIYEDK